jgi:hypothetical protein
METLITINVVILVIVTGIVIYIGLDLKKWHSWLFGAYAFLTLFLAGLIGVGSINEALKVGALGTFALMFVGVTTRLNRERAKKWLREHGKEQEFLDALSKIKPEPKNPPKKEH